MRSFIVLIVIAAALLCAVACAPSLVEPARLTILGDLSTSAPLSSNPLFARKAAAYVASEITSGNWVLGDTIELRRVGERSTSNAMTKVFRLDRKNRHRPVAALVASVIAASAQDPTRGQDETNILWALETGVPTCTPRSTVILISDGIEWNDSFRDVDGLLAGTARLPAPKRPYLRGCRVVVLGLGLVAEGTPPLTLEATRNLEAAWREYLTASAVRPEDTTFVRSL